MKGIMFNEHSVKAILAGEKTQTRRVINGRCNTMHFGTRLGNWSLSQFEGFITPEIVNEKSWLKKWLGFAEWSLQNDVDSAEEIDRQKPRYRAGETVYVKEPWTNFARAYWYKFDRGIVQYAFNNALFMPAHAARYFIEITNVRAERLRDITEADARAEGVRVHPLAPTSIEAYRETWNSINGKTYPWESNPWVWVYEFKLVNKS